MHHTLFSPVATRTMCQNMILVTLTALFVGCSSGQPTSQQANAQPTPQKKGIELNPLKWDSYEFREKYNFKIGDMWIIKPPRQFNPSQIVVVRELGKSPDKPQAQPPVTELYASYVQQKDKADAGMVSEGSSTPVTQMLVIDVISSDALLRDADGHEYPSQVDPALTHKLMELTTDPRWLYQKDIKVKNPTDDQWVYLGVFQENNGENNSVKRKWIVSDVTTNPDLTEVQQLLTQAFEVAHRQVHPLSETVNLIK